MSAAAAFRNAENDVDVVRSRQFCFQLLQLAPWRKIPTLESIRNLLFRSAAWSSEDILSSTGQISLVNLHTDVCSEVFR